MVKEVEVRSLFSVASFLEVVGLIIVFVAGATGVTCFVMSVMLALVVTVLVLGGTVISLLDRIRIQKHFGDEALKSACGDVFPQSAVDVRLYELWLKLNEAATGELRLEGILEGGATLVDVRSREIATARVNLERAIQSAKNAGYRVHDRTNKYSEEPPYFT